MRSSGSSTIVFAVLLHVVLVLAEPEENFGKKLCQNMNTTASHSKLLEGTGNRTSCVVFEVNGTTQYATAVAKAVPLKTTSFNITNIGFFDLILTSECALDPCYRVITSPGDLFTGNYVYSSAGMVNGELAFTAVYDCRGGVQYAHKAEFYKNSAEIREAAKRDYQFDLTEKDLQDCLDNAANA